MLPTSSPPSEESPSIEDWRPSRQSSYIIGGPSWRGWKTLIPSSSSARRASRNVIVVCGLEGAGVERFGKRSGDTDLAEELGPSSRRASLAFLLKGGVVNCRKNA
jgi:hypothetical protein